jgi:hypothetical protein
MTRRSRDAFYVGYQPRAPGPLAWVLSAVTGGLLAGGATLAVVLAMVQRPPAPSVFEYGRSWPFEGVLVERPHPMLLVERPGAGGEAATSIYLLAGVGKRGVVAQVQGRGGSRMRFEGTLIYRGTRTMVEILDHPTFSPASGAPPVTESDLGQVELEGEIVDSKCHLGVMNPGHGATHRLCALRCLRGGLPPLLALGDEAGGDVIILADAAGEAPGERVLPYVGTPVRIAGRLRRIGDWWILEADPASIAHVTARP